eukprot:Gregarina_sp_Pseudo_9__1632@NODE_209_length_3610_cov_60_079530_g194_i0_p2_GENE_NODE_209_length_3610_cov_60_079530_g194_i0NODE_209_length_3610_cov_60_079530_g194_i0_p2_ORF_typecomplete_len367_score45_55UAA/PF08449_11/1_2e69TPT/PF03151_16/1_9e21EamA/PF00892_20/0_00021EamA/PF00892_20/3_7e09SLC35F/PF06027_12/5_9e02SLC35F/PF06027_12/7_8e09Nuc_sug_transp/PF04142_15/13Nuc_sug_transp/PF04142_15/2_3e07CRTlike/PF08627_10/6_7e02CRTlike/PF08627_10/3_9e05CRTlike/PF08627_10/13PUNUT/PF16913_5/2_4e02PUNUT/PF169
MPTRIAPPCSNVQIGQQLGNDVGSKPSAERDEDAKQSSSGSNVFAVLVSILGIYVCFLTQGLIQESIYHTRQSVDGNYFKSPVFLVSINCVCSGIVGAGLVYLNSFSNIKTAAAAFGSDAQTRKDLLREGFLISLTYVSAMCCTNYSLTKVNYPTQVLVKSAKAVPVVVGGWLMYGKRYPIADYIMVLAVTTGLVMFQYANVTKASSSTGAHLLGYLALGGSLLFDGMTGPRQDKLISKYKLNTGEMMVLVNSFAAPLGLLFSLAIEGTTPYNVVWDQAAVFLPRILAFVLCGAAGQFFIVGILRRLGSLQLTLITTSRKFFAILLSVIWFGHPLTAIQWLAVAVIFSSALLKYTTKKGSRKHKHV